MLDELDMVVISNGEISSGEIFGYGDTITVKSGGTLDDAYIPASAGSLTLEAGAILTDTITIGVNTTVQGVVNAGKADINLDISDRKEEDGVLISDWENISSANSISITVNSNQDKGTYVLVAETQFFSNVVTVKNLSGNILGELSIYNSVLDYGMTRYTLSITDSNYLCLTVSSNLNPTSDKVFLVENGKIVQSTSSIQNTEISQSNSFDKLIILSGGIVENISLKQDGELQLSAGAKIHNLTVAATPQQSYLSGLHTVLHAEFNGKDDGGELSGTHYYSDFSYKDGILKNMAVFENSKVIASNGTIVDGLYIAPYGKMILQNSFLTGTIQEFKYNGCSGQSLRVTLENSEMKNAQLKQSSSFYLSVTATNSALSNISYITVNSGRGTTITLKNSTISDSDIDWLVLKASAAGNITVNSLSVESGYGTSVLTGNIIVKQGVGLYGTLDAQGNTITIDMSSRKISDDYFINNLYLISEDAVFTVCLSEDMSPGVYRLASGVGSFVDSFNLTLNSNPDNVLGILNNENQTISTDIWDYCLHYNSTDQTLDLEISVSPSADANYKVWKYDANFLAQHAETFSDLTISQSADVSKVIVLSGGELSDSTLKQDGELQLSAGAKIHNLTVAATPQQSYLSGLHTVLHAEFNGKDDGGELSGTHYYSDFSYKDGILKNMAVFENSKVIASNGTIVDGLYIAPYGKMILQNSFLTGTIQEFKYNGCSGQSLRVTLENSEMKNAQLKQSSSFYLSVTATNSALSNISYITVNSGRGTTITLKNSTISDSDIDRLVLNASAAGNITVNSLSVEYGTSVLTEDICVKDGLSISSYNSVLDVSGNSIFLDMSSRKISDGYFIQNLNNLYNGNLIIVPVKEFGTYTLATNASNIGQGDSKGVWNPDTNIWEYKGEVVGDLDGVIELRDENGILIANCTVNGGTEYSGRYNYTVDVDANGNMNLTIGINSREGLSFAADGYDNDSFAKATKLNGNIGTLDKLTIDSANDVDYYKFTLETAGRASSSIGIDFKMWKGDLDIYLYDAQGNLVDYAKSVTDNETLSLHKLAAGDYYLKVVGYDGNTNDYTLNWNLPKVSTLTDATESGNDKAHSYHLGKLLESVSVNAAISDANDEDYFMFILEKGMTSADSISITYDNAEADLEFYIYGSNGEDLIGRGVKTVDGGFTTSNISFAGFKHGVYYVRVVSADGGAVDYTLNANIGSNDVNPDKWENNNSLSDASNLYAIDGEKTIEKLSIHSDSDVDYFKFKLLEAGSVDDYISITYETKLGDLDLEILDADGKVVAYSRTAENTDTASLNGLAAGEYYVKVYGYNNTVNNYELSYNVTNSALIASDVYEGIEDVAGAINIRQSQTISDLSIASVKRDDETRADTFKITMEYDGWKSSKIILTDYRSDWDGLNYVLSTDAAGTDVIASGVGSEISLAGLKAGDYYLTVDTPVEDQYSEYSVIAQHIPDSTTEIENTWSIFVYLAGDNNLEGAYLTELLYMQKAILPENVEVYVLMDRSEGYSTAQRDWTDTRVGKIRHSNGGAVAVEWMYFEGVDTDTYMNTSNLKQMREWDTGSISTLEAFLDWGMQTGRADNYALIMKDHGTSLGWNSSDETSGSMMSITEISDLLKQEKYDDISVVAFDQCLMGSDVVITEMENAVDYVVASEAIGYTPNQLMMYKVLFNSLESDMTPQELAEKMVASCNCSGKLDLTLAAFDTSDTYLSTALNDFASLASEFTYADWTALCTSFGTAFNYGDSICAFSDLISVLQEALNFTISATLSNALTELISDVTDYVIKAAQITPAAYGNGLAVFNPVLSSDQMNLYYYVGGGSLDYYASSIGEMAWGDFLYTVGQLAEDVSEYITESSGKLTFTDFDYYFGEENKEIVINLGAFSGDGMTLEGLFVAETARFNIEMLQAGIEGDAIRIVADDPDANITIILIQTRPTLFGDERSIRRISTDGVLSLAGVDFVKAGVYSDYELVITTDKATSYTMSFEADWASGVDKFDYDRTGSIDPGKGGNNIADKATQLAAGNYAGLMTYAGDADYYQLNTVYTDELDVTVAGTGLTVKEFDAEGREVQTALYENGRYTLAVANGNYLYIEGSADITQNEVNAYSMQISDVESTYMLTAVVPRPVISIEADLENITSALVVKVLASADARRFYSTDMNTWIEFEGNVTLTQNAVYYFKAEGEFAESDYVSLEVSNIDAIAPDVAENITESVSGYNVDFEWDKAADTGLAGVKGYYFRYGNSQELTGEGEFVAENSFDLTALPVSTYYYQVCTVDNAGNISEWSDLHSFEILPGAVQNPQGDSVTIFWEAIPGVKSYIVEYSTDGFCDSVISFETSGSRLNSIGLPAGTYQWQVRAVNGSEITSGNDITSEGKSSGAQVLVSVEDGCTDVFFASAEGIWGAGYVARHEGMLESWTGTQETVALLRKNRLADIFTGSADADVLVMTDDANGDALFVDDIYTSLPGTLKEQQARIAQINEIRAGAGDDLVDMTSQRFTYEGDGVTIYGGAGDDTIWANNGNNILFGDDGNDRLVGGADDDIIVGGSGDDSMLGGGGNDIFCFCEEWGIDTVEQLAGGSVTLWFQEGSQDNWDKDTFTYNDGSNSVTVIGATSVKVIIGMDGSLPEGAFAGSASNKIFDKQGILA